MNKSVIRAIVAEDMDEILRIMKINMISYYELRNEAWNEPNLKRYFLSKTGVSVKKQCEIVGFSFYEKIRDVIHIHTLQVAPGFQNKTVGGQLFQWYLAMLKTSACKTLTCSVYESNPAYGMYQRLGFETLGVSEGIVQLSLPAQRSRLKTGDYDQLYNSYTCLYFHAWQIHKCHI